MYFNKHRLWEENSYYQMTFFISKSDKLFPNFQDHCAACASRAREQAFIREGKQSLQTHAKIQTRS